MSILSVPEAELRARRSVKWRAYDPDVLPMWVAEMDAALQPAVRDVLMAAIERSDTGYPQGTAYAEAFARMASVRWSWLIDVPAQARRAGDVMNSIAAVLDAVTSPGDSVVINPPVYPPFRYVNARRRIVEAPLTECGRIDLDALAAAFAGPSRPAAYLLCSPHNPTGTVHTGDELGAVMALADQYGVQVIADEIHACLVSPGTEFVPVLAARGGERAVCVTSAGKAWNLAGLKAGLIIAGPAATKVFDELPPIALGSSGHLANLAHTAAILDAQEWIDQLAAEVSSNKVLLATELAARLPEVAYAPAEGTYLAWVDCTPLGLADPAHHFATVGRVAFSAGVDFATSHRQWVRINLACSPEFVVEGVSRMAGCL